MTLRRAHGTAARGGRLLVVETAPADELPEGIPAPTSPPIVRRADGTVLPGAAARQLGARGGVAAAEARQLARLLGLAQLPDEHPFAAYARLARDWRDQHVADLAASVGGGRCSAGVSSVISSAALAMAASRWAYDRGAELGDVSLMAQGARLADQSRAALLTAHELSGREARARPSTTSWPWLEPDDDAKTKGDK